MKKSIFFFILSFIFTGALFAIDIRSGLVRIATDDQTLQPMLYRLVNISGKSKYEPLWFDGDPRTSFIILNIDNRIYRMGASKEYKTSQRQIKNGIEIEYRSVTNRLTQRVLFYKSPYSRVTDGFIIEIEIENYTTREMKVLIKEVCDTVLGEKGGYNFATSSNPRVTDEMIITSDSDEKYVISPGQTSSIALLLDEEAKPDMVVIANWKRLSDSKFYYDSELMKGFTQSPFSINDSALGLYWNERIIPPKGSIKVASTWLTGGPGNEMIDWLSQNYPFPNQELQQAFENPPVVFEEQPAANVPKLDIEAIKELISEIDRAIGNIDNVSDKEIQDILSRLNYLEQSEELAASQSN